jgi:hypothetical protein
LWFFKLGLGLLLGLSTSLALGDQITRQVVSDGLDRYTGEQRIAAEIALDHVRSACADEPGDRVLRRGFQVVSIRLVPGSCRMGGSAFQASVEAYTIYAHRIGEASVQCDATDIVGQCSQQS